MTQNTRPSVGIRQFEKKKEKGFGFYLFEAGSIVATACTTIGVVIFGWQAFTWQQSGTWHEVSLLDLLSWLGLDLHAYGSITDLDGVAGVVQTALSFPAFVMVPVIGFSLFVIASFLPNKGR
jgi:hypothetical protein